MSGGPSGGSADAGSAAGRGRRPLLQSVEEYGRGVVGGLLFSLPLLYTMEVWRQGFLAEAEGLLLYVGVTFLLLLAYNRYGGMRPEATWREVAVDSVEELGIALLLTPAVLFLLGRFGPGDSWHDVLGKTVVEAMTVAVGVSVGTAQLGDGSNEDAVGGDGETGEPDPAPRPRPLGQTVLGFCGATLVASNVGPTEEIVVIGLEASPGRLAGLVAASLLVAAVTFHFSGFAGVGRHVRRGGLLHAAAGIATAYATALAASLLMLWFFGRFDGAAFPAVVAQTVVLAFPAAVGASAGRLLIQSHS